MGKTTTMPVQFPTFLRDELQRRAELEDRSMASLIRLAVQRYLSAANGHPAVTDE